MIICSCNVLSDKDLERAAAEIRADQGRIVTPGGVFKRLGCRPKCGNCFPMVVNVIHRGSAQSGADGRSRATPDSDADWSPENVATARRGEQNKEPET